MVKYPSNSWTKVELSFNLAWENRRCRHWFPYKMTSEKRAQKFPTDNASLLRSGWCPWLVGSLPHPIRSIIQIWVLTPLQCMEFLRSFLRHHFTGKPVKEWRNVVCFLRLLSTKKKKRFGLKWILKLAFQNNLFRQCGCSALVFANCLVTNRRFVK